VVDQLSKEYAGQSVIFLELAVDDLVDLRYGRWWAAINGTSAILPLMMVDSGNKKSYDCANFFDTLK